MLPGRYFLAVIYWLIQVKMIKLMIRLLYMHEKKAKNKVGGQK